MTEKLQIIPALDQRFEHLVEPAHEILAINPAEKNIGRQLKPPIFVNFSEVVNDPLELREAGRIMTDVVNIRNLSETTKQEVILTDVKKVSLPTSQLGSESSDDFVEIVFDIPKGVETRTIREALLDLYAREIFNEDAGSYDPSPKEKEDLLGHLIARLWNYDPLDKRKNQVVKKKERTTYDMDGNDEKEIVSLRLIEPAKESKRKDQSTGTVLFIGNKTDFETEPSIIRNVDKKFRYTDDVSATQGILLYEKRPTNVDAKLIKQFGRLPLDINGSGIANKAVLRLRLKEVHLRYHFNEIDMYFAALEMSDILSGRVNYGVKNGDIGSVGINYKKEVSAITAALNASRYKNLTLETLPGSEEMAQVITEDLIEPLASDQINQAQDIMIVGPPGTGKTAITTALSRIDNGVSFVSISSKQFLKNGTGIIEELVTHHDRYGIHSILVIQDAEAMFTDTLNKGSDGNDAAIDPEKRAIVLELLNGERPTKVKFLLTINKPGCIDEALKRRFLLIYAGLPNPDNSDLYIKMAEGNLSRFLPEDVFFQVAPTLAPMIAEESKGYPPAFIEKLTQMILKPLQRLALSGEITEENARGIIKKKSIRLKKGYPIAEIREQDEMAKKVAAQEVN